MVPNAPRIAATAAATLFSLLAITVPLRAQPARPSGPEPAAPQRILDTVGIDQKLGGKLPLDATFRDEAGKSVRLGDLFTGKPVILSLVYYECPSLCTLTLNGMGKSFKPLDRTIGKDFDVVTVSFDVRNTGKRTGKAVPQLYVSPKAGGWEAPQRLAGFKKIELAPGASTNVRLTVDPRLLATWDAKAHGWSVAAGNYTLTLGASSRDPVAKADVAVPAQALPVGLRKR